MKKITRRNDTLLRLKIATLFVLKKHSKNIQVMTCGMCGGTNIIPVTDPEEGCKEKDNEKVYTWGRAWMCEKCGAVCYEVQQWHAGEK